MAKSRTFTSKHGWHVVGEKRIYFRSKWEYVYAKYLQWQLKAGIIARWEYEPETFWFEAIKRGVRSYRPDFAVYLASGKRYWVEVKGYMDAKSKTKIKRFNKYFPEERLIVVEKTWFISTFGRSDANAKREHNNLSKHKASALSESNTHDG